MYENETFDEIFDRMLNNVPNTIDKREGSVAYDMLAPKAIELAMAYTQLDLVLDLGFPETTYGEYLDRKVYEAGMTRYPAEFATGTITITGDFGEDIEAGTIVYTDTGIRFVTNAAATIPSSGSVNVGVTAEVEGISGNVPIGSITNIELDGMSCTNAVETTGGEDEETDEALLERYRIKITSPGVSGNANHYRQWATSIEGIGDAKVIPIWNGPGTVRVILINRQKRAVTAAKVTEVKNYIETQRPVGATVTVQSATELPINIVANVEIENTYTFATVSAAIKAAIQDYIFNIPFQDGQYVRYNSIGNAILSIDGVSDYTGLTVNGGTANIAISQVQIPVLGTTTFTEV